MQVTVTDFLAIASSNKQPLLVLICLAFVYFHRYSGSPTKAHQSALPFTAGPSLRPGTVSTGVPCALLLAGCLVCEDVVSQHGDLNSIFFILFMLSSWAIYYFVWYLDFIIGSYLFGILVGIRPFFLISLCCPC